MARWVAARRGSDGARLGFEANLTLAADKLRIKMDGAEYKSVALGVTLQCDAGRQRQLRVGA